MNREIILRIPRSDSEGEFVLVNVSSQGSSDLDVKLLATEGESPYVTSIKSSRIRKLLANSSPVGQEEWESILRHALLQHRLEIKDRQILKDLEVVASVGGNQITIIFRRNISQIHQRLGEIVLKKDDEEEIDSISWVSTAVLRGNHLQDELSELQTRYDGQADIIKQLNEQLEDLIQAKKDHETSLLEKFRELLNQKKLKIRDQQRLLATSKVDRETANQIRAARNPSTSPEKPTKKTTSLPSRTRKRKQPPAAVKSESEDEGFEAMDVDKPEPDVEAEAEIDEDDDEDAIPPAETPSHSDLDETEDEDADSEDLDAPAPVTRQAAKRGVGRKGKAVEVERGTGKEEGEKKVASPPPRRELPFEKKGGANGRVTRVGDKDGDEGNGDDSGMAKGRGLEVEKAAAVAAAANDHDEETDDEEL